MMQAVVVLQDTREPPKITRVVTTVVNMFLRLAGKQQRRRGGMVARLIPRTEQATARCTLLFVSSFVDTGGFLAFTNKQRVH